MLVEIFQKIDQNPLASPSYNNQLSKLSNSVQSMNQLVKKFYRSIQELKEKPEDASSDISETDSQMSEGIEDHPAQPDQNAQNVQPDEHPTVIPPATQDQPEEKDNQFVFSLFLIFSIISLFFTLMAFFFIFFFFFFFFLTLHLFHTM